MEAEAGILNAKGGLRSWGSPLTATCFGILTASEPSAEFSPDVLSVSTWLSLVPCRRHPPPWRGAAEIAGLHQATPQAQTRFTPVT